MEAGPAAWHHSRASGLTVVWRLGLLCGLGSGAPPQDVLSSHATPERQSLFESHRQRRWLTHRSYGSLSSVVVERGGGVRVRGIRWDTSTASGWAFIAVGGPCRA